MREMARAGCCHSANLSATSRGGGRVDARCGPTTCGLSESYPSPSSDSPSQTQLDLLVSALIGQLRGGRRAKARVRMLRAKGTVERGADSGPESAIPEPAGQLSELAIRFSSHARSIVPRAGVGAKRRKRGRARGATESGPGAALAPASSPDQLLISYTQQPAPTVTPSCPP